MKRIYLTLVSAALLFAGCTNDLDEGLLRPSTEDSIAVELLGSINQVTTTRVNDDGFCDGDGVGIYVVNYNGESAGTMLDEGNQADNVRYVFNETEYRWTPDYPIYYYDKVTPVDIIGYYPYVSNIDKVNTYSFEVAKDQSTDAANGLMGGYESSDFLWGKAEKITPTASRVNITFHHQMAGVQVELTEGTGWSENEWSGLDKQVLVTNTIRKASIDLATGEVTPIGEVPTTGTVPAVSGDGWRAVVVPQSVGASVALFNITVDGTSYIFRKSEQFEYLSGKLHKFTIEVSKKSASGLEFKLIGEAITAWESETITHDGTAREYVVINVPEASFEHSALKSVIEEMGKDFTKIKYIKVIGEVNANDFYFMRDEMTALQGVNMQNAKCIGNHIPNNAFSKKTLLTRFVFPKNIISIGQDAFYNTGLSGALIIPEGVISIGSAGGLDGTFGVCKNLTSLSLPSTLEIIGSRAFSGCSGLQGNLLIPHSVKHIYSEAFAGSNFTGELELPENLETLGYSAFADCKFTGSVDIPSKIVNIEDGVFNNCYNLNGSLKLHQGIINIGSHAFGGCKFRGPLILPEGVLTIGSQAFSGNLFSGTLKLPQSLISLGAQAFWGCERITGVVEIPEEILIIPQECFWLCTQLEGIVIGENVEQIHNYAFQSCYQLNSIVCKALVPPILDVSAFDGVSKDNFVVEVPEASVSDYTLAPNWKEFKRIAVHREFSISRNLFRVLNAEDSKNLILQAESGAAWSVESCPDWVTVTPSSGVGKTEVTISVNEMTAGDVATFDVEEYDSWGSTTSTTYNGRSGEVVFLLDGKDYRTRTKVEQYDYEYGDGDVITNQTATVGNGVNIVFMGDCFDAQDIAIGKYLNGINEAIEHFFAVEPYATYKDYFNVYTVFGLSPDSGMGTASTIREAKFGSQYTLKAGITPNIETCYEYACKSPTVSLDIIHQSTIVIIENSNEYGGVTYMWGDGSSIAICPMINDEYPYDFRGVVQHEVGGHAFGKLGDEYIYHGTFIQTCSCPCCPHVEEFNRMKSYGFYDNLSLSVNIYDVPWAHLIFDEKYQNSVDVYEGGYFHARGVSRSEQNSCMNNNIPYFSAISRQAIVERIMEYAGEEFSFEEWKAKDKGIYTGEESTATTRSATPNYVERSSGQQQPPKFMGEKPNLNFNK